MSTEVREAEHRFANHLALLSGFVHLKAADLARQPIEPTFSGVQLLLKSVCSQIESIAHLHRSLASGSHEAPADLGERVHGICAPLSSLFDGKITLVEDISPDCQVEGDRMLPLTQIVAEVVTNALKYSHPLGQAGTILIRIRKDEVGTIVVEIADDGPGLPEDFDVVRDCGIGFEIVLALAKQLGALIEFESGRGGLLFRLTLPTLVNST